MAIKKNKCPKCKASFTHKEKKPSPPTSLFHYTSFEVVTKILKDKGTREDIINLHFWFSNPLQTNDKKEIHFFNEDLYKGVKGKKLKKQIEEISTEIGYPFTLSLVHQRQNMSNEIPIWKMYGDNFKGIRLKFKFEKLKQYILQQTSTALIPCNYLNKTQMEEITRNIKKSQDERLEEIYKKAVSYKMNEWAYENEWRIVHWNNNNTDVGYRSSDGRLYLPVTIPLDCLEAIEIGPKADQDAIEGSLNLIKAKIGDIKENHFKIIRSKLQIGYV